MMMIITNKDPPREFCVVTTCSNNKYRFFLSIGFCCGEADRRYPRHMYWLRNKHSLFHASTEEIMLHRSHYCDDYNQFVN